VGWLEGGRGEVLLKRTEDKLYEQRLRINKADHYAQKAF